MVLPVLTALVIIFIVWINYEIHKTDKLGSDTSQSFWNREKTFVPKQHSDISSLDCITITTELLPMSDTSDQTADSYRNTIQGLSGKKAINLSGYTNTELTLSYGTSNIGLLMEWDNNYTILVSILQKWAERLYYLGDLKSSRAVLEYGLACHTDVAGSYLLLAKLYRQSGEATQIAVLIQVVGNTRIHNHEDLIRELHSIMNSNS